MESKIIVNDKLPNNTQYVIFEDGTVFDIVNNKEVKPTILKEIIYKHGKSKKAYKVVIINGTMFKVHRLVAENFIKYPFGDTKNLTVNHKDGNTLNNHYTNLAWNTLKENIRHAFKNGLSTAAARSGTNQYKAKLTENDVHVICKALEEYPSKSPYVISKMLNYKWYDIYDIARYKAWTEISSKYNFTPRINIEKKLDVVIAIIRYIRKGYICNEILDKMGIKIKNGNTLFRGLYNYCKLKLIPMLERVGYYSINFPTTAMMKTAILKYCYPEKYGDINEYKLK